MNISKEDLIKRFDPSLESIPDDIIVVQFDEKLNLTLENPLPLSHYCYVILNVANSCDDPRVKYVIYQNLETGCVWTREINDFFENQDISFSSGKNTLVPRFTEISEKQIDILYQNLLTIRSTLRHFLISLTS